MQQREYQGLMLKVYESHLEYEKEEQASFAWSDSEGNILDIKTEDIDFSGAESKEHFTEDANYKPEPLMWHATTLKEFGLGITCIMCEKPKKLQFSDLLYTVGHELGHITDAGEFNNSVAPYETEEGYQQEETKALRFEKFTMDTFSMAMLFFEMFRSIGVMVSLPEVFID